MDDTQTIASVARPKLTRPCVEYNVAEHCNLSCYLCDHASPLLPTKLASLAQFSSDLTALAKVFHCDLLLIQGGEPLLHPQLPLFLSEARRIGIADSIGIVTNGVQLHRASDAFWEGVDQLWISVYPDVNRRLSDDDCARLCEIHDVALHFNQMATFNRTLLNDRIEDPKLVAKIFAECKIANEWSCHTVHEGRFYRCSPAPFMKQRLNLRGIDFDNRATDGVRLHDNPNLYEELDACLNSRTALAACSYCLGTSGPAVAHRQLSRRERALWLAEDHRSDIDAVRARLFARTYRAKKWVRETLARIRRLLRIRARVRGLRRRLQRIDRHAN